MQQGGQYGEVPPYARPNSASSNANANTTTHAHLFNLSHEVAAAAGGLGLSSNPPSISHAAASTGHQHHAGATLPYSLGQVHQHHHSLHQQQPQYLHFQDHLSHLHHQQSLQSASHTSQQPQLVDHSGTVSSASSPAGLHLHQSLQKQGMVPSISIGVQQHGAGGQETQQQMQQTSILQQQYTQQQQQQQHTLGLGLESPKPSTSTLQQASRVQQQQQQATGSSSQGSTAIAAAAVGSSGIVTNVLAQSSAPSSNLMSSTAAAASTMVTPNLGAVGAAAMSGLQQIGLGSNNNNSMNKQQGDQGAGAAAPGGVQVMIHQQAEDMQDVLGDELDKGGGGGNRWPRQETLALLKVRSEMDSSFRDSSLKRPLWDEVSRKLAELGYQRSAKKCKEKFENVHKYYKRTKEGKAGRQDGKNYRFFSELEALYGNAGNNQPRGDLSRSLPAGLLLGSSPGAPSRPIDMSARISNPATASFVRPLAADASGLNFSSETSSSSDDDNDDEYDDPSDAAPESKKRKRKTLSRMMAFFESLLKQVMEKQEQMQQRFLDALERREQDRMIREEAWKRQEMARMSRENDLRAQERSLAATRDAAIVAFLQKLTGQTVQLPTTTALAIAAPPMQVHPPPHHVPMAPSALDPTFHHIPEDQDPFDPNSKRWPKPEVLALIKLRTGLHSRFTEPGPKGPLWEDIANGMSRLGYNRNAKRCKEKWENINKYFKKAKESNKNRPENAKTCPYYHQLDALYKQGVLGSGSIGNSIKALPYKTSSDNIDNVDTPMLVHQASGRGGRVEGDLVGHGSTSADQVLAIMPPASQMSTASDATASTDNAIAPVATANTAGSHLFSASNPDNSGGDMTSKDINVQIAGGISPDMRPVNENMSETNVAVDNTPRVGQQSEETSMQKTRLEMQRGNEDPQNSRGLSNQGFMEHKAVDLEQDARQLVEEDEVQQKQQVLLQAQIQQYQQEMRVSGAPLSQPGLATQSFIANMLQKFNNDPAESNTSTTSTNQEH